MGKEGLARILLCTVNRAHPPPSPLKNTLGQVLCESSGLRGGSVLCVVTHCAGEACRAGGLWPGEYRCDEFAGSNCHFVPATGPHHPWPEVAMGEEEQEEGREGMWMCEITPTM